MRDKTPGIKGMLNVALRTLKSKNSLKTCSIWNIWKLSSRKGETVLLAKDNCCCSLAVVSDSLWFHGQQMPGFPVLHYLLQFAQTHVHWVNDAIQPPHHLSPTSPPALNLSQHQVTFPISWLLTSGRQGIEASASVSASVLPMNIQDWFPLGLTGWISL